VIVRVQDVAGGRAVAKEVYDRLVCAVDRVTRMSKGI
jgi:hypothetical protein